MPSRMAFGDMAGERMATKTKADGPEEIYAGASLRVGLDLLLSVTRKVRLKRSSI